MRTLVLARAYLLSAIWLLSSQVSWSSPASEVASAFDEGDKIDIHASVGYELTVRRAAIKREFSGFGGADVGDPIPIAKDLVYKGTRHELVPRLEVGFFHDISFSVAMPIVIYDSRRLEFDQRDEPCIFPGGTSAATCINSDNSTTVRDGLLPASGFDANDPTGPGFTASGDPTIFRGPNRSGLDQLHLGLAWAAMNQERDKTKPTWKIGAEMRLSVGAVQALDAVDPASSNGVSRGLHELHLWTTMAKRIKWAEPNFELWYIAPVGQRDASPFVDLGFGQTSKDPQQRAGTRFGLEAVLWQNPAERQRVSLDVGAELTAFFEGRAYTEMWEVFAYAGRASGDGPLVLDSDPVAPGIQQASHPGVTNVENHMRFGTRIGVSGEIGQHIRFGSEFRMYVDQQHLLTYADAGRDGSDLNELVDLDTDEVNPAYVETIDLVGRRYRLDDAVDYVFLVSGRYLY